jgi:hypothetical protein
MLPDSTKSQIADDPKRRTGAYGKAGQVRMIAVSRQLEAERKALAASLLSGLGRPVTMVDEIAAETLSSAIVRARRLREIGKSDAEMLKLVVQASRAFNLKPQPPAPPPMTLAQQLAARGYAPPQPANGAPIDSDGADDTDEFDDETALSDSRNATEDA